MDFKEINFSSTPVKRIRFRNDLLQTEAEPLIQNDLDDELNLMRNGDIPREGFLFTFFSF
jgi:hypothetical protein